MLKYRGTINIASVIPRVHTRGLVMFNIKKGHIIFSTLTCLHVVSFWRTSMFLNYLIFAVIPRILPLVRTFLFSILLPTVYMTL